MQKAENSKRTEFDTHVIVYLHFPTVQLNWNWLKSRITEFHIFNPDSHDFSFMHVDVMMRHWILDVELQNKTRQFGSLDAGWRKYPNWLPNIWRWIRHLKLRRRDGWPTKHAGLTRSDPISMKEYSAKSTFASDHRRRLQRQEAWLVFSEATQKIYSISEYWKILIRIPNMVP